MRLCFRVVVYAACKYFDGRNIDYLHCLIVCFNVSCFVFDITCIKLKSQITNKLNFNYIYINLHDMRLCFRVVGCAVCK